ncbi:MAG: membrane dipeptidase [Rhabdochlamydiaceae bacterium]|nr:membrane dipeptidase [Candidatus Amphrikana amoebophyrae]
MQKPFSVVNLHCDLLGCIEANNNLGFESEEIRCSLPQELDGGVKLETLAIAAISSDKSAKQGERQVKLYLDMLKKYSDKVGSFLRGDSEDKLLFLFAIENASVLAIDDEPLTLAFDRFERYNTVEKILYISFTWNEENRFGGGNITKVGIKEDGKTLLEYMSGKGVAIDFSHTSDQLAYDIINHIEKKGLQIPFIASHSNYRCVKDIPRNLPDEIAKEIIKRNGVIGLNFVRRFVGEKSSDFLLHIEHALSLGGENAIALGADFYGGFPLPKYMQTPEYYPPFQKDFSDASTYQRFLQMVSDRFSQDLVEKIAHQNGRNFIKQLQNQVASLKIVAEKNLHR